MNTPDLARFPVDPMQLQNEPADFGLLPRLSLIKPPTRKLDQR